jgi:hypothetical protein
MEIEAMNRHTGKPLILLLFGVALVSVPAFADDAKMMDQLAQIKKNCEQQQAEARRREQKSEQQLAAAKANASLPPEKIQEVQTKIDIMKTDIAKTDEFLAQPLPSTKEEQESYIQKAMGAIATTRERESVVARDLGVDPTSRVEALLGRLGDAQDFKTQRGAFDWENHAYNPDPNAPIVKGPNTNFFGAAGQLPPSAVSTNQVSGAYKPTTVKDATDISNNDHGVGGGIMLEGSAEGFDHFSSVDYDGGVNALVLNLNGDDVVYFVKIPPWSLATMCREIGTDRNMLLGVSETGANGLVFGDKADIYKGTDLAYELMLADKFLGDVIFASHNPWTQGYKFPSREPTEGKVKSDMLVRFAFGNFQFAAHDGRLSVVSSSLEVRMMPVSKSQSPTGQMLPDYNAMEKDWTPPDAFVANARILTENVNYFRREALIEQVFSDGETAAVLRSLKKSGQDLNALADQIETGHVR